MLIQSVYRAAGKAQVHSSIVCVSLIAAFAFAASPDARASLNAYYTLDDLTEGTRNRGTDGGTSDLSALDAGATPTVVSGGIVGNALSFDGNDLLRNLTAGNVADDLTAYPLTLSVWMRNNLLDTLRDSVFGVSDRTVADRYYTVGAEGVTGGRGEPEMVRRNTTFTPLDATGADVSGANWRNVVAVFGTSTAQIYVGGKLINSAAIGQTFNPSVNTINLGGFLRNNGTTPTDPYRGQADEAGLFDTALTAADVALINGLGLTGSIGLDQLDEAQALNAMPVDSSAQIGAVAWRKVSSLSGTTGDFGGTVAGGDAFIVTDSSGNGLQLVPEPTAAGLLIAGVTMLIRRRPRHC